MRYYVECRTSNQACARLLCCLYERAGSVFVGGFFFLQRLKQQHQHYPCAIGLRESRGWRGSDLVMLDLLRGVDHRGVGDGSSNWTIGSGALPTLRNVCSLTTNGSMIDRYGSMRSRHAPTRLEQRASTGGRLLRALAGTHTREARGRAVRSSSAPACCLGLRFDERPSGRGQSAL